MVAQNADAASSANTTVISVELEPEPDAYGDSRKRDTILLAGCRVSAAVHIARLMERAEVFALELKEERRRAQQVREVLVREATRVLDGALERLRLLPAADASGIVTRSATDVEAEAVAREHLGEVLQEAERALERYCDWAPETETLWKAVSQRNDAALAVARGEVLLTLSCHDVHAVGRVLAKYSNITSVSAPTVSNNPTDAVHEVHTAVLPVVHALASDVRALASHHRLLLRAWQRKLQRALCDASSRDAGVRAQQSTQASPCTCTSFD